MCGYVGLKNAGATCYMNSVLQQLFVQPVIKQAILSAEREDEEGQDEKDKWVRGVTVIPNSTSLSMSDANVNNSIQYIVIFGTVKLLPPFEKEWLYN